MFSSLFVNSSVYVMHISVYYIFIRFLVLTLDVFWKWDEGFI